MTEKEWNINCKLSDIVLFDTGKMPFYVFHRFKELWESSSSEDKIIIKRLLIDLKDKLPWKEILEYVKENMNIVVFD